MLNSARAIGKPIVITLSLISCAFALVSCAGKQPQVTQDSFSADSRYQRKYKASQATACDAARRALLGDGYNIENAASDQVKGRKAYQSEGDRSTFIEMNLVCVGDPSGSTLYANGVLSTYDVKKAGGSASVGLSALGSVSLPFGQSADSMVKTSDQTVTDREFYRRFFSAVATVLAEMEPGNKGSEGSAAKPEGGKHQPAQMTHQTMPAATPEPNEAAPSSTKPTTPTSPTAAPQAKSASVATEPASSKAATSEMK